MKKSLLILVGLSMFLAATVMAVNPRDMQFEPLRFDLPEPVRFETDNGISVYFLEDHQLPVITLSVMFHGGSVYDPPEKSGLAELTATLLRSGGAGTRTPEEVDEELDYYSIDLSSNAGDEALVVNMNSLAKNDELAFEIMADMMRRPRFDSAKMALEISNLQDEIRRRNDEAGNVTRRVYYQTVYGGHPYGRYPTLASVAALSRADIVAMHEKYYNPDNCLMAVAGDLTPAELKDLIDRYLGGWSRAGRELPEVPRATRQYEPGVYYAEKDINQAHIRFGHLCMDIKNPDRYAMDIMNFALGGGGFISRIMGQVRTTHGLAYSVGTYVYRRPLMGTLFAYCQTRADAMGRAMEMMLDIIEEVKREGITTEEFELARESIINGFVFNYDTPGKIAGNFAYNEFHGFPPDQLKRDLEAYQAVTLDDCNRVAARYLDTEDIVIVVTGNKEMFDRPMADFGPVTAVSMEIE